MKHINILPIFIRNINTNTKNATESYIKRAYIQLLEIIFNILMENIFFKS
jgi:hypothetical protein